jgi:hypothetical protein
MSDHLRPLSEGSLCPACSQTFLARIDDSTAKSRRGHPMAVVACSLCGWHEGWVRSLYTGDMIKLWCGKRLVRISEPQFDKPSVYGRL